MTDDEISRFLLEVAELRRNAQRPAQHRADRATSVALEPDPNVVAANERSIRTFTRPQPVVPAGLGRPVPGDAASPPLQPEIPAPTTPPVRPRADLAARIPDELVVRPQAATFFDRVRSLPVTGPSTGSVHGMGAVPPAPTMLGR